MKFERTAIPDVVLITPKVFGDERGFFMETYKASCFADFGICDQFVQDNHSGSGRGTLRGLHYQLRRPQGKLVRVICGEIYDVAVDLRQSSPTFGKWIGTTLSAENRFQLWVPQGFAHGFCVTSDWAEVIYKATEFYAPEDERVLLWSDPTLGICWPDSGRPPILSDKDIAGLSFSSSEFYE